MSILNRLMYALRQGIAHSHEPMAHSKGISILQTISQYLCEHFEETRNAACPPSRVAQAMRAGIWALARQRRVKWGFEATSTVHSGGPL
jgi:hypothetical protein